MVNKLQQLTDDDKIEVLSGTSKVLPLRPSDNGWTAEQIREKGYQGIERLFDKVKKSLYTVIDDLNAKADQAEVAEDIAYLSNNLSILDSKIDDKDAELKAKIKQIEDVIRDITIEGDFATKEDLQNVIEIAEGKTKSYLLSCNDIIQEEFLPYMTYYNSRGEVLTSEQVMSFVNNGTCVNNLFNSQDNQVPVWDISNWYLIVEYNYPAMQNNAKVIISNMDNPFKQGDILIVTETDVPDRYATDIGIFYKMETSKVDLSTVVHKSGDETISGVKTFSNGIYVGLSQIYDSQYGFYLVSNKGTIYTQSSFNTTNSNATLGNNNYRWKSVMLSEEIDIGKTNGQKWYNGVDNYGCYYISRGGDIKVYATSSEFQVFGNLKLSGNIISEGTAQYKKTRLLTESEYEALTDEEKNNGVIYDIYED